jgi:preprotein translocase subunit SecA
VWQEINDKVSQSLVSKGKEGADSSGDKILLSWLQMTFPIGFSEKDLDSKETDPKTGAPAPADPDKLTDRLFAKVENAYVQKESMENPESLRWLERHIMLDALDRLWQEHLYAMDHLRSSIGLRAYAQKDPLVEYRHEAYRMFNSLTRDINQEILNNMFRSATSLAAFERLFASLPQMLIHESIDNPGQAEAEAGAQGPIPGQDAPPELDQEIKITFKREMPKVGRNDPCPCGSGKKFKKCCG